MLRRILNAFAAPAPPPLPEPDARLALGALMVRIAKSDGQYELSEIKRIDRLLMRLYALGPLEAARMRATCERLERAAPGTERFGTLIRETVAHETRLDALEALWEVVLSDGESQPQELRVIEAACATMGLSQSDSDAARALAERQ